MAITNYTPFISLAWKFCSCRRRLRLYNNIKCTQLNNSNEFKTEQITIIHLYIILCICTCNVLLYAIYPRPTYIIREAFGVNQDTAHAVINMQTYGNFGHSLP